MVESLSLCDIVIPEMKGLALKRLGLAGGLKLEQVH